MNCLNRERLERILLIRLSAVGDVINTLPALTALRNRFPHAVIGFLVEDRAGDLITGHPCVDRVHLYPRRRWEAMLLRPDRWRDLTAEVFAFARDLRRQRYDVALDFQGNLKGAVHGIFSGARVRVGFSPGHCRELNHLFTHVHVAPPAEALNRVDKFLFLAKALGASPEGAAYRLPSSATSCDRVNSFLAANGLKPNSFISMHPGTSDFGREKRWMPERFSELACRVWSTWGLPSVITWGPGERALADQVASGSGGRAISAMETRTLLDLAELLRNSKLFVGCDSGPLHLSSAVGVPSVALFGPKDPRIYGPHNPRSRVVYRPNGNGSSMAAISVEEVCNSIQDLLRLPA